MFTTAFVRIARQSFGPVNETNKNKYNKLCVKKKKKTLRKRGLRGPDVTWSTDAHVARAPSARVYALTREFRIRPVSVEEDANATSPR